MAFAETAKLAVTGFSNYLWKKIFPLSLQTLPQLPASHTTISSATANSGQAKSQPSTKRTPLEEYCGAQKTGNEIKLYKHSVHPRKHPERIPLEQANELQAKGYTIKSVVKDPNTKLSITEYFRPVTQPTTPCHDMPGDGNCFYHALADQLNRRLNLNLSDKAKRDMSSQLRLLVLDYIRDNIEFYQEFSSEINNGFFKEHEKDGAYAVDIIIDAFSKALNCNFLILQSDGSQPIVKRQNKPIFTFHFGYQVETPEFPGHYQSLVSSPINHFSDNAINNTAIDDAAVESLASNEDELYYTIRRPKTQTLYDSFFIALEIKKQGGGKNMQLAAQNSNRPRL